MDDGHKNTDVAMDGADAYNEWFKAAAWNDALQANTTYGFGRNVLTGADANFRASGDPMDDGTTPSGYFDGSIKGLLFATNPNENGFGLFDMTGNAYHWMQGRFNNHPDSIDFRTLRGGGWDDVADAVGLTAASRTFTAPALTDGRIGFRVMRTVPVRNGDVDLDGDVDVQDFITAPVCLAGPDQIDTLDPGCLALDLDGDGDVDLADVAAFQLAFTGSP